MPNVLVKVYSDGYVEVHGGRHVNARIVFLGRSVTFPEHEIALEHAVLDSLPGVYRAIHGRIVTNGHRGVDGQVRATEGHYEAHQQEASAAAPDGNPLETAIRARSGEV